MPAITEESLWPKRKLSGISCSASEREISTWKFLRQKCTKRFTKEERGGGRGGGIKNLKPSLFSFFSQTRATNCLGQKIIKITPTESVTNLLPRLIKNYLILGRWKLAFKGLFRRAISACHFTSVQYDCGLKIINVDERRGDRLVVSAIESSMWWPRFESGSILSLSFVLFVEIRRELIWTILNQVKLF